MQPAIDKFQRYLDKCFLGGNEEPFVEASLVGADLAGLEGARRKFGRVDLTGADLSGALLECADMSNAVLNRCRLRGADLKWASLVDAQIDGVDWYNAKLHYVRWPETYGGLTGGVGGWGHTLVEKNRVRMPLRAIGGKRTRSFSGGADHYWYAMIGYNGVFWESSKPKAGGANSLPWLRSGRRTEGTTTSRPSCSASETTLVVVPSWTTLPRLRGGLTAITAPRLGAVV